MTGGGEQAKPISLFYSYSHRDEELRDRLEEHLASLRWSGMISEWHDRNINVGADWENEINSHLLSADIILLLVSASFIASEYCWSVEVKAALERHERGETRVVPVILRPCRWCIAPFAKLQAAPKDGKAVTDWPSLDSAFGDRITKKDANFTPDVRDILWWAFAKNKTSQVGAYLPNPWGLYDMHGNVLEWIEDVWRSNYYGAPTDGSAWLLGGDKDIHVARGGSSIDLSWELRSEHRVKSQPDNRDHIIGFRVARTLD